MGRPSLLTAQLTKEITDYIDEGLNFDDAARCAGISETTFYRWKAKGRRAKRGRYREFWEAIKRAEAERKRRRLEVVHAAYLKPSRKVRIIRDPDPQDPANPQKGTIREIIVETRPPDWKAAAWALERSNPEEFGRRVVQHEGEIGGGDRVDVHFHTPAAAPPQPVDVDAVTGEEGDDATDRAGADIRPEAV